MEEKILIVDDEKKICSILSRIFTDEGYTVMTVDSGEEALKCVDSFAPELILMDQNMPGINGIEAMVEIKKQHPEITALILTAYGSIRFAVEAIKKGAYDYLTKPLDNDELMIVTRRALEHNRLTKEIVQLRDQLQEKYSFENIIGQSPAMQLMFERIRRVCTTNSTVLVQGQSGTGKELVAKAIHFNSKRKERPLISVNCGAIPAGLIESEFFGHEKGAFTDAKEKKIGSFEQAHEGTLLLDEIGELPLEAQVKLLRVFEEQTIIRVGGQKPIPVDVRIITATNKNLEKEVNDGNFRLDLLYRLNIYTITVPPLIKRSDDIPLLVEHFIRKYNKQIGLNIDSISESVMTLLKNYRWPGNVRDLENALQSAMISSENNTIKIEDLPLRIRSVPDSTQEMDIEAVGFESYIRKINAQIEKDLLISYLNKYENNRTATAKALKISRKTLFNKIKMYNITS